MKENRIEELQERLETLHVIQDARLACNADDLDIREEIAEVEEELKELHDDTNVDKEDSIKNERSSIEEDIKWIEKIIKNCDDCGLHECIACEICWTEVQAIKHVLKDYKKLQEEFKDVDHECERLEEKEVRLIKENEYYENLINALEAYYNITREDLEECIKNDK